MEKGRDVGKTGWWVGVMLATVLAGVQTATAPGVAGQIPWEEDGWRVQAQDARVETYMGREALFLRGGTAWLDGAVLRDGVVEFDLAASPAQGFHGVRFRAEEPRTHEHIYLRPHLSGLPDATQYNPVIQGVSSWQLYHGPPYTLPLEIPADRWIRVQLAVLDGRAQLRVDGGEPRHYTALVRPPVAGALGLTSSGAGAWFANVVVRRGRSEAEAVLEAPPEAASRAAVGGEPSEGSEPRWRVSDPFAEERVDGVVELGGLAFAGMWQTVGTDHRGMVNLARWAARSSDANTVFAGLTLEADEARTVMARLAFSDRARVFLNGRQLWSGADEWSTRDYRFLGTAGYFDAIFLPLRPGANELLVAVSEDFGGWVVGMTLPPEVEARP